MIVLLLTTISPLADPRLVGLPVVLLISTGHGVAEGEADEAIFAAEVGTVELRTPEGTLFESGVAVGPEPVAVTVTVAVTVEPPGVVVVAGAS